MMSILHLDLKSLTMFVHVATTTTWMTKNDISNGFDFNPRGGLVLCTLKMMKINRQVNFVASYPNLVSFQPCSFMFDTNLWIENNHMKCSSHMAFLCVQNFTLLQKKIEIFVANSMIKKNTNVFLEIVKYLYMVQVGSNEYTRMFKKFPCIFC